MRTSRLARWLLLMVMTVACPWTARGEDDKCAKSEKCRELGECALGENEQCRPGSEDHCRNAAICRDRGACHFVVLKGGPTLDAKDGDDDAYTN